MRCLNLKKLCIDKSFSHLLKHITQLINACNIYLRALDGFIIHICGKKNKLAGCLCLIIKRDVLSGYMSLIRHDRVDNISG